MPARRIGSSLPSYFAARTARHERLQLLDFTTGRNGNFTFLLSRRADDLRGGSAVRRLGKGRVDCADGTIGVWSLGGAPAPTTFGPCVRDPLPLPVDLAPARRAVRIFVARVFAELTPGLDVRDARVTSVVRAARSPDGYAARVRCGRAVQTRTAVVRVRFPYVARTNRLSSAAFYVSRIRSGWLVWRLVG